MTASALVLWFPAVLAVHNADECMRGNEWMRAYRVGRMGTRCAVRASVVGMVLAAIWVAGMAYETGGAVWVWASRAAVFAMLLNGLGHGLLSVKRREVVTGNGFSGFAGGALCRADGCEYAGGTRELAGALAGVRSAGCGGDAGGHCAVFCAGIRWVLGDPKGWRSVSEKALGLSYAVGVRDRACMSPVKCRWPQEISLPVGVAIVGDAVVWR